MKSRSAPFHSNTILSVAILFIALFYLGSDLVSHNWTRADGSKERGVIHWDVISYYAYLPATFIYGDVTLGFLDNPPEGFVNDAKFWFMHLDNGNRLIATSMGMSVMYSPFFFMAHGLAPLFGEARDGYGSIYQLFLVLSSLVYVIIGFVILKKLLLRFFDTRTTLITLLSIGFGTNLYFYSTHEAAMAHANGFFLITLYLWLVIRWYEKQTIINTILIGVLLGLISLIRPTNILVLLLLLGYNVKSIKELGQRIGFFLRHYYLVLIMVAGFILVWVPQFLYWHTITGHYIFNSYGPFGGRFYFSQPHIFENLFGYKKGWFVYVPVMLLAVLGIPLLRRRIEGMFWPLLVLMPCMIYVQSSWWCWWFGGGFGMRTYIEIFGILAIPLAATIEFASGKKARWMGYAYLSLLAILIIFHQLNTYQYKRNIIHYNGMNKEVYWKSFMKTTCPQDFWQSLTLPDYTLARKGIYVFYLTGNKNEDLKEMGEEKGQEELAERIRADQKLSSEVKRYAKRSGITMEEAMDEVTECMYDQMVNK